MKRREFIAVVGGMLAAWGSPAAAQKQEVRLIGLLSPFTREETEPWQKAFREGLRALGWTEGVNVRFEYRYGDGQVETLPRLVAELIDRKVEILVVTVNSDAIPAAKATKTIPIVMASPGDPIGTGLVASLAHPGGNVTGLTQIDTDLAAKRLQILKEVAPGVARIAVLWDSRIAVAKEGWHEIQEPARQSGMALHSLEVHGGEEIDAAFARAADEHDGAILALPGPVTVVNKERIVALALKYRLPSIFHLPEFVRAGGLLSYGTDRADLFRGAAGYVDKILKGAKPGDLPVEQATKFQLVVNLRTAKALGLTVPREVLAYADEVIE